MRIVTIQKQSIEELNHKVEAIAGPVGANHIDHKMDACDIIDKFDDMLKIFGLEVIMFEGVGEEPIVTVSERVAFEVSIRYRLSAGKNADGHFPDQEQAETFFQQILDDFRINYPEPTYFIDDHRIDLAYGSPMLRTVSVARWADKPQPVPEGKSPRALEEPFIRMTLSTYDMPKGGCYGKDCAGCDRLRPEGGRR